MLPNPTNAATTLLGNMSETVEYRLADHAWCAAPARPINATALQSLTWVTNTIGMAHNAATSMVVLRATLGRTPERTSRPGTHPPKTLSTVTIA